MVVELREQAAPWVAVDGTGKEEGRNKAEQDEATHGSCHVSNLCCAMLQEKRVLLLACFFFSCGWFDEVGIWWYI